MRAIGRRVTLSVVMIFVTLGGVVAGTTAASTQGRLLSWNSMMATMAAFRGVAPRARLPEYGRGFHAGRGEGEEDADEDDQVMMEEERRGSRPTAHLLGEAGQRSWRGHAGQLAGQQHGGSKHPASVGSNPDHAHRSSRRPDRLAANRQSPPCVSALFQLSSPSNAGPVVCLSRDFGHSCN